MDGVNVLVHAHLVCEHLWAVRTWHVGFSFKSGATFCSHKMGFQLLEYFSTAMASLFVEVSMHLSVMDIYISFSATGEGTSSACSKLSSVAILHVDPQHLHFCWAQRTLLLWLFMIQPLVNPQLYFREHFCTDITLSSSMRLYMFCPRIGVVKLLRAVVTCDGFPVIDHLVFYQAALSLELCTGA